MKLSINSPNHPKPTRRNLSGGIFFKYADAPNMPASVWYSGVTIDGEQRDIAADNGVVHRVYEDELAKEIVILGNLDIKLS